MPIRFSADQTTHDLVVAKLQSSGLTPEHGRQLKMRGLTANETVACHQHFKPLRSLHIPYFDPGGVEEIDWPNCPNYYRLRYLEQEAGFKALTKDKSPTYIQLPNTLPVAYYPLTCANWMEICDDVDAPLILTEGELKAAKACQEGFPTIGLGGVWGFRSGQHGLQWISSLDSVTWPRRNVYICFDSDLHMNKHVQLAIKGLISALQDRGAYCHIVCLPQIEGQKKVGLDDYFVLSGESATTSFRRLLQLAEPFGSAKTLFAINTQYSYIENPGLVVNTKTNAKFSPTAFKDHVAATIRYEQRYLRPDGSIGTELVSGAPEWIKWPLRHESSYLTYEPGKPTEFIDHENLRVYNTWPGWGCQPKKGDVKPFLKLVKHLFTDAEPGAMEWFLRWCAFPIQYPGTKLFSAVVMHSAVEGTGKSLLGETLGKLYGKNFASIDQGMLHSTFNEWSEAKQFIMGDEVTGSDKRQDNDMLKTLITRTQIRINIKHVQSFVIPDCINYYFTSNHANAFFLSAYDRRFFVHEVRAEPLSEEFYQDYGKLWMDARDGPPALLYYLQHLELGDFNAQAPAFKTAAKMRMIDSNQSDLQDWVRQLVATPDLYLKAGTVASTRDLWTSRELLFLYDPDGKTRVTAKGIARALREIPIMPVLRGLQARLSDGSQGVYYPIRNTDKWLKGGADKIGPIRKHIEETKKPPATKPPKY